MTLFSNAPHESGLSATDRVSLLWGDGRGHRVPADKTSTPSIGSTPLYPGDAPLTSQSHTSSGDSCRGPFSPQVNGLLKACFGGLVEEIPVTKAEGAKNRGIGAKAHTIGRKVSLGDEVTDDPGDGQSMEVIAHEVAHALAHGGSGKHILNKPGDPGESAADEAGRGFRQFVEGGARGPAPQLKPAHGGQAAIHRWGSGEHYEAMHNAAEILRQEGRPGGGKVDNIVAQRMRAPITLANNMTVDPADLTPLMGDYYGKFDKKGNFDPSASFEQLTHADPEEMRELLFIVQRERKLGKEAPASLLEAVTSNRSAKKGELSYLELAQKNKSHFSAENMEGTNNNMGAYSEFHRLALEAAQNGDQNRARALEACGMHYLTDRHSAGHNIDKQGVMNASGYSGDGVLPNMHVKAVHDDMNEHGITVNNAPDGPAAAQWRAYGDGHWADAGNKENRRRTAESVYTSWSELGDVLNHSKSAAQIKKEGYGAYKTVPQWNQQRQEGAEQTSRNLSAAGLAWKYKGELPDAAFAKEVGFVGSVENAASEKWHAGGASLHNGINEAKGVLGDAWTGVQHRASSLASAGGKALNKGASAASEGIHNGLHWLKDKF